MVVGQVLEGGVGVSDFSCDRCGAPAGLMIQHGACVLRCPRCSAPGSGALLQTIAGSLQGRYRAVLLDADSREVEVVAVGVGTTLVSEVLAATTSGAFVWMKPVEKDRQETGS